MSFDKARKSVKVAMGVMAGITITATVVFFVWSLLKIFGAVE